MTTTTPPGVPVFYPGQSATAQLNAGVRDTFDFLNNKPKFKARRAAAQTVTEGSHTWMSWDTVDFDSANGWGPNQSPAQSADKYVVQAAGWYLVTARVSLSGTGASGLVLIPAVAVNGKPPSGAGSPGWEGPELYVPTGSSTQPKAVNAVWEVYAPLGSVIQLDLFFSTESSITSTDTTVGWQPEISLVWSGR